MVESALRRAGDGAQLVVRARRVVTPVGTVAADVAVRDGSIVAVEPYGQGNGRGAAKVVELAADEVLLPGLVDTHVHVNEPGRGDWEGFASATRAAATGGVTTIADMPLNSIPPTVDVAALEAKRESAAAQCHVDVAFWGGAVPENLAEMPALHEAGVVGFKCFLVDSGVEEFAHLDADGLEAALRVVRAFDGLVAVHAESAAVIAGAPVVSGSSYAQFLLSRPPTAEDVAIGETIERARRTGARAHVVHLSSAGALPALSAARSAGLRVSVETCPHYLALAAEEVPDGATEFKCCPPIRAADNRERLWEGLAGGTIDCIVSDHSPCPPDLKCRDTGDFDAAWGGISSLQLALPVVWTEARQRGFGLGDVVGWMAARPAEIAGLTRKGRLAPGYDADLVVFAPDRTYTVDPSDLRHRHRLTPYAGRTLAGVVRRTFVRGVEVDDSPRGRLLSRGDP